MRAAIAHETLRSMHLLNSAVLVVLGLSAAHAHPGAETWNPYARERLRTALGDAIADSYPGVELSVIHHPAGSKRCDEAYRSGNRVNYRSGDGTSAEPSDPDLTLALPLAGEHLHAWLRGTDSLEAEIERTTSPGSSPWEYSIQLSVVRGAGQILSTLLLDDSRIGRSALPPDAWHLVSRFIRFPDSYPTWTMELERRAQAAGLRERCVDTADAWQSEALYPRFVGMQYSPDPAGSSAAVTGPLWEAASLFGREVVFETVLVALKDMTTFRKGLTDWAGATIRAAGARNVALQIFLEDEFRQRGVHWGVQNAPAAPQMTRRSLQPKP